MNPALSAYLNALSPEDRARVEARLEANATAGKSPGTQLGTRRGPALTPAQRAGEASGTLRRQERRLRQLHDRLPNLPPSLPALSKTLPPAARADFDAAYVRWAEAQAQLAVTPSDPHAEAQRRAAVRTIARIAGGHDRLEAGYVRRHRETHLPLHSRAYHRWTLAEVFRYV